MRRRRRRPPGSPSGCGRSRSDGWLRIGAIQHSPRPGAAPGGAARRRHARRRCSAAGSTSSLHGRRPRTAARRRTPWPPCLPALGPGRHQIIEITADGLRRWIRGRRGPRAARSWNGAGTRSAATFSAAPLGARRRRSRRDRRPRRPSPHGPRRRRPRAAGPDRRGLRGPLRRRQDPAGRGDAAPPAGHPPRGRLHPPVPDRRARRRAHRGRGRGVRYGTCTPGGAEHGSELVYQGPPPAPRAARGAPCGAASGCAASPSSRGCSTCTDYVAQQTVRLDAGRLYPPELYVPQRFRDAGPARTRRSATTSSARCRPAGRRPRPVPAGARRLRPRQDLRAARGRPPDPGGAAAPRPDPHRAAGARQGALGGRAGRRPPRQPRRGPHRPARRSTTCSARAGSCCCSTGSTSWSRRVTYDRAADHLDTLLQAAAGQGEDRGGQPHPALQVARPGADRARREGRRCCRSGGCSASRTSPPRRSGGTSSTGTATRPPPTPGCGC